MSLLLLIETATTSCSVALAKDNTILALREIDQRNIHAEVITVFINELFKQAGLAYADLDAIAVSSGPGSYTGLRIGVSTAKGLCFALDKPLITVETLSAMAYGLLGSGFAVEPNDLLCPMIDARRMEVYTALFDVMGNEVKPTSAEIIDENSFSNILVKRRIVFFGDGAAKCKTVLGNKPNAVFIDDFVNSAKHILTLTLKKFNNKEFEDVAYFEPYYLKDFIAGVKS